MKPCPACSLLHSFIRSLPVRGTGGGWGFSRCWFSGGRAPVYGHLREPDAVGRRQGRRMPGARDYFPPEATRWLLLLHLTWAPPCLTNPQSTIRATPTLGKKEEDSRVT